MFVNARHRHDALSFPMPARLKRRLVSVSPLAATMLLTAAIFLLPATGEHRVARASVDGMSVSSIAIDAGHDGQNRTIRQ